MHAAPRLLPVFLKLAGRSVLVVGGGTVAAQKVNALLATGAQVTLVAPRILPVLEGQGLRIVQREFQEQDLKGMAFVVAAAPPEVNRQVARLAEARGLFVNAVDDPANASAYLGGVVHKSGVTLAVSTGGRAPALAALLRQALDALLPDEIETWLDTAERERLKWRQDQTPFPRRRRLLYDALVRLYQEPKGEEA